MNNMYELYLIDHLKRYVKFEISQGYSLKDIYDALTNYGYKEELVDQVFHGLHNLKPPTVKPASKAQMKEDMHLYIQNMLIDYVKKQSNNGYSFKAIRAALLRAGHHSNMINQAIKLVKKGKVIDYDHPVGFSLPTQLIFGFSLFLMLVFILFISISTDQNIGKVIYVMVPAILSLILTNVIITSTRMMALRRFMPLVSIGVIVLIFVAMMNYTTVYNNASITVLMGLNVGSGFILNGFLSIFAPKSKKQV